MAGSPFYVPVLIGLGAVELSMNANSIAKVRRVISGISFEDTRSLVRELESCRTAEEAESLVRQAANHRWPHLFDRDEFKGKVVE